MANNQMTHQDAEAVLVNDVYAPIFFDKLANDWGIRPSSAEEYREFLVLAGKLQQLDELNQIKQANDRTTLVASASSALDSLATGHTQTWPAYSDAEIKEASAGLARNQKLRDAALLYQDSVRSFLAQQ